MTRPQEEIRKDSLALAKAIVNELNRGTKHYDEAGRLLETPLEIVKAFQRGGVYFDCPTEESA